MFADDTTRVRHMLDALRNKLIHAYFDINRDIVRETVSTDIPALSSRLENILS